MTYFAFQFWFFTKDVYVNCIGAAILTTFSLVGTALILPESPRWLFSRKRFQKTKSVISYIARRNSSSALRNMDNIVFATELKGDAGGNNSDNDDDDGVKTVESKKDNINVSTSNISEDLQTRDG